MQTFDYKKFPFVDTPPFFPLVFKDLLFPDEDEMTDLPCPSARLEELLIR